jgi:hypothetical protein
MYSCFPELNNDDDPLNYMLLLITFPTVVSGS